MMHSNNLSTRSSKKPSTGSPVFQVFKAIVNSDFKTHSHASITIKVIDMLDYIETNIDEVIKHVKTASLFRHPHNHLAMHLTGYSDQIQAKKNLLDLVNTVKACLTEILSIEDKSLREQIIDSFMLNINDSDVGCMEVRLRDALTFFAMYKSNGCVRLEDLMLRFSNTYSSLSVENLLDFFGDCIEHNLLIQSNEGKVCPLTWKSIKKYCIETLGWEDLETDWLKYGQTSQEKILITEEKSRHSSWYWHYFSDEKTAKCYLAYLKSIAPARFKSDLAKASVQDSSVSQHTKNYTRTFYFKLTHEQFSELKLNHKIDLKEKGKIEDEDSIVKDKGKEKIKGEDHIEKYRLPKWHLPIVNEILSELAKRSTKINYLKEQKTLETNHPKLWKERAFILRHYFNPEMIKGKNWYLCAFKDLDAAIEHLNFFKLLLASQYPDFIQFAEIRYNEDYPNSPYFFRLNTAQYETLQELIMTDSLGKSLRFDENCFAKIATKSITPTPGSYRPPLRYGKHKKFTTYGHGVEERANKKTSPYLHTVPGKFKTLAEVKRKKAKRSRHQSTSLLVHSSKIFGHNKKRVDKLAGWMLDFNDALIRTMSKYDGGTVGRNYEADSLDEALTYYNEKVLGKGTKQPVLHPTIDHFKPAIKNLDNYNEVLACVRFNINTSSVGIFSDTFEARCIAQFYAYLMHTRLKQQYQELGLTLDDNYQVPITYYLPNNRKNFKPYRNTEMDEDRKRAEAIVNNSASFNKAVNNNDVEFLWLLDSKQIQTLLYNKLPIIKWLFYKLGLFDFAESLFERTSLHRKKKLSFAEYLATDQYDKYQGINPPSLLALNNNTVLHIAAQRGDADLTRVLIQRRDINCKNLDGFTPLQLAIKRNHTEVVKVLTEAKADVTIQYQHGLTSLHYAVQYGNADMLEVLLKAKADPNKEDKEGYTPLHHAAWYGNADMLKVLLEAKADPNKEDKDGWTSLNLAAQYGNADMLKVLLNAKADPNKEIKDGWTPLNLAARYGNKDMVQVLLEAKADPNKKNKDVWTPLQLAARYGNAEMLEILLNAGANPTKKDKDGWTPLHIATRYGNTEMVKVLLKAGANTFNNETKDGWTSLHIAARYGNAEMVKVLLNAGANNFNKENKDGWTPLHYAVRYGNAEMIVALIKAGADTNRRIGMKGPTLLDLAFANSQAVEVTRVLHLNKIKNYRKKLKSREKEYDPRIPLPFFKKNGYSKDVKLKAAKELKLAIKNNRAVGFQFLPPLKNGTLFKIVKELPADLKESLNLK